MFEANRKLKTLELLEAYVTKKNNVNYPQFSHQVLL